MKRLFLWLQGVALIYSVPVELMMSTIIFNVFNNCFSYPNTVQIYWTLSVTP